MRRWVLWGAGIVAVVATAAGIRLADSALRSESPPAGWQWIRPPDEVSALTERGEVMWVGGNDGLFPIDRATGEIIADIDVPRFRVVRALLTDSAGGLWVGHRDGLTHYDGSEWLPITDPSLPDTGVFALLEDTTGRIWVGTLRGAAVADGDSWTPITDGLLHEMVNVIEEDHVGGIWFGSFVAPEGGISRLDPDGTWQHFTTDDGLPHNNITTITALVEGSVWAGMGLFERGGAVRFRFDEGTWRIAAGLDAADGLPADKVRYIYEDSGGVLWMSTEFAGVARLTGDPWPVYTVEDGLTGNEAKVILRDHSGDLWFGTDNGLTRVDGAVLPPADTTR